MVESPAEAAQASDAVTDADEEERLRLDAAVKLDDNFWTTFFNWWQQGSKGRGVPCEPRGELLGLRSFLCASACRSGTDAGFESCALHWPYLSQPHTVYTVPKGRCGAHSLQRH